MENREANNAEVKPQELDRLFELFLACREMDSESRRVWLREACQGDLSLESGVERLIREDLSAEGFLSRPTDFVTRLFASRLQKDSASAVTPLQVLWGAAAWARYGRRTTKSWIALLP